MPDNIALLAEPVWQNTVHVNSLNALQTAVNAAAVPTVIVLDNDISIGNNPWIQVPTNKTLKITGGTVIRKLDSGGGPYRIISTANGSDVYLENVEIADLNLSGNNAAAYISGNLYLLSGASFHDNKGYIGAAILITSIGILTINGGEIYNNSGTLYSAIYNQGTVILESGRIYNNTTSADGPVGTNINGNFYMRGGEIFDNRARNNGGGVYFSSNGACELIGGTITNNSASQGGGVFSALGPLLIDGVTISSNNATVGGGVYCTQIVSCTMKSGTVSDNTASHGGGIFSSSNNVCELIGGLITGNTASTYGGGVHAFTGSLHIDGVTISSNKASQGAGVYCERLSSGIMDSGEIIDNIGTGNSGGGMMILGEFTVNGGLISRNTDHYGAGIMVDRYDGASPYGHLTINGGEISYNVSDSGGGGVGATSNATVVMNGGLISGNTAGQYGGGLYLYGGGTINGGEIIGNTANEGGGIYVPNWYLDKLTVAADVVFSNNKAARAYNRNPVDDELYYSHIFATQWTVSFSQGYNNYDIGYTNGTPVSVVASAVISGTKSVK